jgi:hypothetical protein
MISSKDDAIRKLNSIIEKIEAGTYQVERIQSNEDFSKSMAGEDYWSMVDISMKFRRIA